MSRGVCDTFIMVVHAASQAERVLVVGSGEGVGGATGAPGSGRRWRWGATVVVVHASSEAEGVLGVVVSLLVFVAQRFVPKVVQVVW